VGCGVRFINPLALRRSIAIFHISELMERIRK